MFILVVFSFLAGLVTVLSPCVLPLLPIILSSSVGVDHSDSKKPYGIILGFILSFTFLTLFVTTIVNLTGLSSSLLRNISIFVILFFGVSMLFPNTQVFIETLFSKISGKVPQTNKKGFLGGILVGLSLGFLWTPCVGPILASVISLAIVGKVTFSAFLITLAYSFGTAIPMFLIIKGGSTALKKVPWLTKNTANIQKIFGIIMISTALLIAFGYDRKFQTYILEKFPSYGTGLTKIEDVKIVKDQLTDMGVDQNNLNLEVQNMDYPKQGLAKELVPGGEWFNSEPLTLKQLKGKVVLVDFWTYSCINCQRTLPYLREWWKKYKDDGLLIIGVHSPEFEFEKEAKNVKRAVEDFRLEYPVMQDNNFSTWRAYNNRYWPAKYLIDKDGNIRYTHFGEGEYDETEKAIQDLLKETGSTVNREIENPTYSIYSRTPETYLGYERMKGFSSNEKVVRNIFSLYSKPTSLPRNTVAYDGEWLVSEEYSNPKKRASLYLNYESKNVFLVMKPRSEKSVVKVYLDGEFVKDVVVDSDSLYTLVEMDQPGQHLLQLEFQDSDVEVYAFTFG